MWLTGFDVPPLHTLYMDKFLSGHNLMQAIARINRVYKDKPAGLVVDYLGIANELKNALEFYTQSGGKGAFVQDKDKIIDKMQENYEILMQMIHRINPLDYFTLDSQGKLALIAQPDFITQELFEWACEEVQSKKGIDCSNARLLRFEEGLCVQILHIGSYDEEPQSLAKIEEFITRNGLQNDIGKDNLTRAHHEIYLSNPNKTPTHKFKTILRIPVRDG